MNPLTGQAEFNGTSILDVTDPASPRTLAHIPGEPGFDEDGGAQMVRVCDNRGLRNAADPAGFTMLRTQGNAGHQLFDVTDPAKPRLLASIPAGHTHKSWWECDTGIAYLVSGLRPPWRVRRMTQVYDLNDPAKPVHIRDFGLPGQQIREARRCRMPMPGTAPCRPSCMAGSRPGRRATGSTSAMAPMPAGSCRSSTGPSSWRGRGSRPMPTCGRRKSGGW